jgi:hypothetical protein
MVRSTVGKVMWVGRATVFLVGLAVILALVLGAASIAFGANGKPFILGRGNVATKVSTLTNKGQGAALNLKVQPGQPPLAVNSSTQVLGLNADQLDNRTASQFMASSVYKTEATTDRGTVLGDNSEVKTMSCDPGDTVLSGGPASVAAGSRVLDNFPIDTRTWQSRIFPVNATTTGDEFTVVILCANNL